MDQAPNQDYRILSVADIVSASATRTEFVPTPEWCPEGVPPDQRDKVGVIVGEFVRGDMHEIRRNSMVPDGRGGMTTDDEQLDYNMFMRGVKQPQFSAEQLPLLRGLSNAPYQRIVQAISRLNNMGDTAVKDAEKKFPDR